MEWLASHGIIAAPSINKQVITCCPSEINNNANAQQWIQFDATAEQADNLLYADFYVWKHSSGVHDLSTEEYHLPAHIQEHVDYITPGTRLRSRNAKISSGDELSKRFSDRLNSGGAKPFIQQLHGQPTTNLTTCDKYVTADCTRGKLDAVLVVSVADEGS